MRISVKDAKTKLTELLRRVEAGEDVTITRDGVPVVDVVKHVPKAKAVNWQALRAYKQRHGLGRVVEVIPHDFDDPLPEDFLITPRA